MEKIFNLLDDRLKEDIYKHIDNLLSFEISALNYKIGGCTEENWSKLSKEDKKNYIIVTLILWNARFESRKLNGESEEDLRKLREQLEELTNILYEDYIINN